MKREFKMRLGMEPEQDTTLLVKDGGGKVVERWRTKKVETSKDHAFVTFAITGYKDTSTI